MSLMLLTDDNVSYLKATVKADQPQLKSSHLSEALAFAAGFNTNAAMLASAKTWTSQWPYLVGINGSQMAIRLRELGYSVPDTIELSAITQSSRLPDRICAVVKNRDIPAMNAWYYECKQRNIPYIYIERKRKYVHVHWDCISLNTDNEEHCTGDTGDQLMKLMFSNFQTIARKRSTKAFFTGSGFVGTIEHLNPDSGFEMAEMLFAMLYLPLNSQAAAA